MTDPSPCQELQAEADTLRRRCEALDLLMDKMQAQARADREKQYLNGLALGYTAGYEAGLSSGAHRAEGKEKAKTDG